MNIDIIINHLQNEVDWKSRSLKLMDKRHKIPKRLIKEIDKINSMINYLKSNIKDSKQD